jgi:hypothetical protein
MKTIQTKSGEILLVKVPEDATWWEIFENDIGEFLTKTLGLNQMFLQYGKHSTIMGKSVPNIMYCAPKDFYLPKGNWVIIGKFSELEGKDLEEFVEFKKVKGQYEMCYYYKDYPTNTITHGTTKNSFTSLCKSQGIEDDLNQYLIIKKL